MSLEEVFCQNVQLTQGTQSARRRVKIATILEVDLHGAHPIF